MIFFLKFWKVRCHLFVFIEFFKVIKFFAIHHTAVNSLQILLEFILEFYMVNLESILQVWSRDTGTRVTDGLILSMRCLSLPNLLFPNHTCFFWRNRGLRKKFVVMHHSCCACLSLISVIDSCITKIRHRGIYHKLARLRSFKQSLFFYAEFQLTTIRSIFRAHIENTYIFQFSLFDIRVDQSRVQNIGWIHKSSIEHYRAPPQIRTCLILIGSTMVSASIQKQRVFNLTLIQLHIKFGLLLETMSSPLHLYFLLISINSIRNSHMLTQLGHFWLENSRLNSLLFDVQNLERILFDDVIFLDFEGNRRHDFSIRLSWLIRIKRLRLLIDLSLSKIFHNHGRPPSWRSSFRYLFLIRLQLDINTSPKRLVCLLDNAAANYIGNPRLCLPSSFSLFSIFVLLLIIFVLHQFKISNFLALSETLLHSSEFSLLRPSHFYLLLQDYCGWLRNGFE